MKSYSILLLCLVVAIQFGTAQNHAKSEFINISSEFPYVLEHFNTRQGLPQNHVVGFAVSDDQDFLVVTPHDALHFTGDDLKILNPENYLSWDSKISRDSAIFVGGNNSADINLLTSKSTNYLNFINNKIQIDDKDTVLALVGNGVLYKLKHDLSKVFSKFDTGIKGNYLLSAYESKSHYLVGSAKALYSVNKKSLEKEVLINDFIRGIKAHPFQDGKLLVIGNGDVYLVDLNNEMFNVTPLNLNSKHSRDSQIFKFEDISFVNENELFISSSNGLFYMNNEDILFLSIEDGMPSAHFTQIYVDKVKDLILIGTTDNGFLSLTKKNSRTLNVNHPIKRHSIQSVVVDDNNNLYCAGMNGQVFIKKGFDLYPFMRFDESIASLSFVDGMMVVGTWGNGFILVDVNDKKIVQKNYGDGIECVLGAFKHSNGLIYLSTMKGLFIGDSFKSLQKSAISDERILEIYQLKNGNLALGGVNKVTLINKENNVLRIINENDGLKCREVRSFYEDEQGKLWIGTYRGGLYCFDKDTLRSINKMKNAMLYEDFFTLLYCKNGFLVSTSNKGIWTIEEKRLQDFYYGKIDYLIPFHFSKNVGIDNPEFNGGFFNKGLLKSNGNFYFPSVNGLVFFEPIMPKVRGLNFKLERITVDNEQVLATGGLDFPRNFSELTFNFSVSHYQSINDLYFQNKLVRNGDEIGEWSPLSKDSKVKLKTLIHGDYQLFVKVVGAENQSVPEMLVINFSIEKFFYEQWWFRVLMMMLILSLISLFVFYKNKMNAIKNRNTIKLETELLELKLKAVQARMNPHFIFNCLNNINFQMVDENYQEAEKSLQHFSALVRIFLDNSDKNFSLVSNELKMIELYLNLEQKRFMNSFDFSIECADEIKESSIPTIILQPLVENAIRHGISNIKYRGLIEVKFQKINGDIVITVEDNGVGRTVSTREKSTSLREKIYGLNLVKQKIKIIRDKFNVHIDLEIIDKTGPESGTIIILKIPQNDKVFNN